MRIFCQKITFLIMMFVIMLFISPLSEAGTTHIYTGGVVQGISNGEITVNARRYTLASAVRVLAINKRNGAYFEDKSNLSEIRVGQPVKIKVEAATVYEVLIERWKQ